MPTQASNPAHNVMADSLAPQKKPSNGTINTAKLVKKALRLDEMYCMPKACDHVRHQGQRTQHRAIQPRCARAPCA